MGRVIGQIVNAPWLDVMDQFRVQLGSAVVRFPKSDDIEKMAKHLLGNRIEPLRFFGVRMVR